MFEILLFPMIELFLIGILSGIVGVLAILRSRIFFSESISHATFPGAIIGVAIGNAVMSARGNTDQGVLSLWLFAGAIVMCVLLSILMNMLAKIPELSSQASAGIILTFGFSLGYFLNKWFSPLPLNIESFLTGSLLHVNQLDILVALCVLCLVLIVLAFYGKKLVFYCFDSDAFAVARHNCAFAEMVILAIIVMTIVAMIPAVGTILSIALLAAPAACVKPFVRSVDSFFIAAPICGVAIGMSGLFVAVYFNLSTGGSIAVLAGVCYFLSRCVCALRIFPK